MAGPLSGIGSQQIPLSQPFQPGGTDNARAVRQEAEKEPQNNEIQKTRTTQAAQAREADTDNDNHKSRSNDALAKSLSSASNSNDPSSAPPRGSVVNLTV